MFPDDVVAAAQQILERARAAGLMIATAESCTGGLVAAALTDRPGSSEIFDRGFTVYSYEAKTELLGVDRDLIVQTGAVSEGVVRAMAEGALANSHAGLSVAITGIAGPGGGIPQKPVGLVHFATAMPGGKTVHRMEQFGDLGRGQVREASVRVALQMLLERLEELSAARPRPVLMSERP
ncbi:MAG: CinA family protein [Proteobacteria bacterium]|nr:CinA family protein [Pseudomonadota bacterium]